MTNDSILKERIAENLKYYRKSKKITQYQLAEKLNYSDKSISKWERGESIPDVLILAKLAEFYNITINDFLGKSPRKSVEKIQKKHVITTLLWFTVVWAIAFILFIVFNIIDLQGFRNWMVFIYALPISFIVAYILMEIWGTKLLRLITVTIILWTLIVSIINTFPTSELSFLYITAIPLQILIILWTMLRK